MLVDIYKNSTQPPESAYLSVPAGTEPDSLNLPPGGESGIWELFKRHIEITEQDQCAPLPAIELIRQITATGYALHGVLFSEGSVDEAS